MRSFAILAVIVGVLALAAFWIVTMPATVPASALGPYSPDLANGRTMLYAGGCPACHATPDQDDRTRLGGGVAIKLAVGTFYAPNISPDPNDGIGRWSEADFVTAMQKGTSPSGQHYFPVFPYSSYRNMKLADVRDLFAYLKTLPPVAGRTRDHDVRFPLNIRRSLGGWKFLFVDGPLGGEPWQPDPSRTPAWNRGAYLVNGPGHCAECHSPRNILGGIKSGQRFAGGPDPVGDGWVPNITQKGLGAWSEHDIAYLLETGDTPDGDSVGGDMTKVVKNTSQLAPQDRAAIATYLKSLPPVEGPTPPPKKKSD
jgi:mono/diheme cytochrome c family protein